MKTTLLKFIFLVSKNPGIVFVVLYIFMRSIKQLHKKVLILVLAVFMLIAPSCGTNTDQPVFPFYLISTVSSPAIVSVTPVETITDSLDLIYEFDLQYYITNSEEGFLGYNLYITTSTSSAEATIAGIGTNPYLPLGIQPSFSHVGEEANTSTITTQRITHRNPPPNESAFELCEKYYFRLSAVARSGVVSIPGAEASSCAATDTGICPSGSICNP